MPRIKKRAKKNEKKLNKNYALFALAVIIICAYFFWPKSNSNPEKINELLINKVALVDSFYSLNPEFTDDTIVLLKTKGLSYDVYKDKDVTVDFYQMLPQKGYDLIILRVHSGVLDNPSSGYPTFLFTTEPYTTSKYGTQQLIGQILSGKTDPDNETEIPVFTVGPSFITSLDGNFNNTIIVLSSCLGLYTTQLADAFISKGASVFISWDEKVSLSHTDEAFNYFINSISNTEMNVTYVVEKVMEKVGPDPDYGSILKYFPDNSGNLIIKFKS